MSVTFVTSDSQKSALKFTLEDRFWCNCFGGGFRFGKMRRGSASADELAAANPSTRNSLGPQPPTDQELAAELRQINKILHKHVSPSVYMWREVADIFMRAAYVVLYLYILHGKWTSYDGYSSVEGLVIAVSVFLPSFAVLRWVRWQLDTKQFKAFDEIRAHLANDVCPRYAARCLTWLLGSITVVDSRCMDSDGNCHRNGTATGRWYVGVESIPKPPAPGTITGAAAAQQAQDPADSVAVEVLAEPTAAVVDAAVAVPVADLMEPLLPAQVRTAWVPSPRNEQSCVIDFPPPSK